MKKWKPQKDRESCVLLDSDFENDRFGACVLCAHSDDCKVCISEDVGKDGFTHKTNKSELIKMRKLYPPTTKLDKFLMECQRKMNDIFITC